MEKKIKTWLERKLYEDYDYAVDCAEIDKIVALEWELPSGLADLSGIRKRVTTIGYDVIKQSCNIYDTMRPKFEILPRGPEDGDASERLERWLEWQMQRANEFSETEPFRELLQQAVTYGRVCAQLEYSDDLPNDKQSEYPFGISIHHPAIVHYDMGGGIPRKVAPLSIEYASDILEHWQPYVASKTVKSAIAKLQKLADEDPDQYVVYFDYMDKDRRYVCYQPTQLDSLPQDFEFEEDDVVEILDETNKRGYINWAIAKSPLGSILNSMYKSGLIENQNIADTLSDYTITRRAFFPVFKHTSTTNKEMEAPDFTGNANGVLELGPTEDAEPMNPPPMDPGLREVMDRNAQKMGATSGVQNISSIEATNVQSSTLSTVVQLRMMEVKPYGRTAEKALARLAKIMFLCVNKSRKSIVGIRSATTRKGAKGDKILLAPDDFDPDALIISCKLLSNNDTDRQQRINEFSTLLKIGFHVDMQEFLEQLGLGDPEKLEAAWTKDQIKGAKLQALIAEIMQVPQLKAAAAQMQMQLDAQAQAQPQGQNPMQSGQNMPVMPNEAMQTGFDQAGGDMNNPAAGGMSPYESVPEGTQTVMQ